MEILLRLRHPFHCCVLLAAMACALCTWAQTPPASLPAEEFLRQQERERALRQQLEPMPTARLPRKTEKSSARIPDHETSCVPIDRIVLEGEHSERFQWALAAANLAANQPDAATPRCLGTIGIELVMRRVQDAIVSRGFPTTRVLAGPQLRLAERVLVLTLFPGQVSAVRFAPGTSGRATWRNALPVSEGDVLNLRDVEQGLENLRRVPGVEASIDVVPAAQPNAGPGQSDLVVHWKQGQPWRVSLGLDDAGSKATGKYQGSVTLSCDNCLSLNDLFYVSSTRSLGGGLPGQRGSESAIVHYSLPLGYWLLGATASQSRYHQSVAGLSQSFNYHGESANAEIRLSRVVFRDAIRKTTVSIRGWARSSRNYIEDVEVEGQRQRLGGWGASVSQRQLMGDAALDLTFDYRRGTGAAHGWLPAESTLGVGSARPRVLTVEAQLGLPFVAVGQSWRYSATLRAQKNYSPLALQDWFAIGSRYTVRGFSGEQQLVAERGWLLRNELGLALAGGRMGEAYLGMDAGAVAADCDCLPGRHLAGMALGWRARAMNLNWDASAGFPLARPAGFKSQPVFGFNLNWMF